MIYEITTRFTNRLERAKVEKFEIDAIDHVAAENEANKQAEKIRRGNPDLVKYLILDIHRKSEVPEIKREFKRPLNMKELLAQNASLITDLIAANARIEELKTENAKLNGKIGALSRKSN